MPVSGIGTPDYAVCKIVHSGNSCHGLKSEENPTVLQVHPLWRVPEDGRVLCS